MLQRRDGWSILVKPTLKCNYDCQYCYAKHERSNPNSPVMSYKIVDHIARLASEYSTKIHWIWHGGEPTLMGVDWYLGAQEIFTNYYNSTFEQNLQTNGSLLDESWAKFASHYDVSIGVSYDILSQYVRGKDYDYVSLINTFKKYNLKLGSISVINQNNIDNLVEMYEWCKIYNPTADSVFNLLFQSEYGVENNVNLEQSSKFNEAFSKYYKYWVYDSSIRIKERLVAEITSNIIGDRDVCCPNHDCRYGWLCVLPDGTIYPCDREYPEMYRVGNIMDFKSIKDIYMQQGYINYSSDIESRFNNHCKKCDYFIYCNGGCNAIHSTATGSCAGLDTSVCFLFKNKFIEAYDILRNIDIYNEKINPVLVEKLVSHSAFLTKEIEEFLRIKGYTKQLQYIKQVDNLLKCDEFKVFRLFNTFKGGINNHTNHVTYKHEFSINLNKPIDLNVYKKTRFDLMETIFNDKQEEFLKILE